jgi:hypothetical protein
MGDEKSCGVVCCVLFVLCLFWTGSLHICHPPKATRAGSRAGVDGPLAWCRYNTIPYLHPTTLSTSPLQSFSPVSLLKEQLQYTTNALLQLRWYLYFNIVSDLSHLAHFSRLPLCFSNGGSCDGFIEIPFCVSIEEDYLRRTYHERLNELYERLLHKTASLSYHVYPTVTSRCYCSDQILDSYNESQWSYLRVNQELLGRAVYKGRYHRRLW